MPNRILHESACTSESVNQLTESAELLFYRLIVQADDFGRFDARPSVIRARCFALRLDQWPEERVRSTLGEIETAQMVHIYEVGGLPFGEFIQWSKFQRVRAARSKWPSPDGEMLTADSNPPSRVRPRASDSDSDSDSALVLEGGRGGKPFADFWAAYPRKVGKPKAAAAFDQAARRADAADIVTGAERYRDDPQRTPTFTAHPTTWLNRDGWEDDPLPARDASGEMHQIADELRARGL